MRAEEVGKAIEAYPNLGAHGFVTLRQMRSYPGMTVTGERNDLLSARGLAEIELAVQWFAEAPRTRTIGPYSPGSYELKHVIERNTGNYLTNGACIAAAVIAGVAVRTDGDSPNARLGIGRRWYMQRFHEEMRPEPVRTNLLRGTGY